MRRIIPCFLLMSGLFVLAGCQEWPLTEQTGKAVRFTASSVQSTSTRTAYSGEGTTGPEGELTWERIDWMSGDKIRVFSNNAVRRVGYESQKPENELFFWADYTVDAVSVKREDPNISQATLKNAIDDGNGPGNGLVWTADNKVADFYAIYPAPAVDDAQGPFANPAQIQFQVPGEQGAKDATAEDGVIAPDMNLAVMLAAVKDASPSDDSQTPGIILGFYPAFTAFEISISGDAGNEGPIYLDKVEMMASTPLCGTVAATIAPEEGTYTATETSPSLTFLFPQGTSISAGQSITFTVFALPLEITGLTLKFYTGSTGEEIQVAKLKKDGSDITFNPCVKNRLYGIAMPDGIKFYASLEEMAYAGYDVIF